MPALNLSPLQRLPIRQPRQKVQTVPSKQQSKQQSKQSQSLRRVSFLTAVAALSCFAAAPVDARESRAVATPFQVGDTLAGSWLAAINAGARNDTFAASTYFREVLRYDPGNKVVLERAFVATLANGDMDDAFRIAEKLVRSDRSHSLARLALAVRSIKARHYVTARTHLARSQNSRSNDLTGTLITAWTWQGSRKSKQALATLDKLSNPNMKLFKDYHGALIANASGDKDTAIKRMTEAYNAAKNTMTVVLSYAALKQSSDKAGAVAALQQLDKEIPRHPTVQAALRDANADKALRLYAANAVEGVAEALYQLSTATNQRGAELVPMIYLRLALFLAPENDLAIISLADIYERLKQHERAIDVYEMMPRTSPLNSLAQLQIGVELESLEKKEEALKHLTGLVGKSPKDPDAILALANLQRSRKQFADAAKLYSRALVLSDKNDRGNWTTYYFRAICYERTKQWPPAEADFKKSLELYPDHPSVLNYLGYSWVDRGLNLNEAFRMLRRAVELRPTDGAIVDSLGWAYYRLGKYEDALRELERAVELRPSDSVINDHLGDVYWKVGRKLEAGFQWNHARDLEPEPDDKPRILKKIQVGLDVVEREEAEKKKAENAPAPEQPQAPAPAAPVGGPVKSDGG